MRFVCIMWCELAELTAAAAAAVTLFFFSRLFQYLFISVEVSSSKKILYISFFSSFLFFIVFSVANDIDACLHLNKSYGWCYQFYFTGLEFKVNWKTYRLKCGQKLKFYAQVRWERQIRNRDTNSHTQSSNNEECLWKKHIMLVDDSICNLTMCNSDP